MIAEKMSNLHQLNIPINKDSTWLWDTMDRWLQQPIKDVNWSNDNLELDQILSTNLCDEARWLKYEYIQYYILNFIITWKIFKYNCVFIISENI